MDMNEQEKRKAILDKLVKLSALADENSNTFQNEVSVASGKISEIMNKYSISWAELHAARSEKENAAFEEAFKDAYADTSFRRIKAWHWHLARVVASATNTKYFSSGHRIVFYGLESQSTFATEMFMEWLGMLDRISLKAQKEFVRAHGRSYESRYFRSSWLQGCLTQMANNVYEEQKKARNENSTAIVLFTEKLESAYKERSKGFKTVPVGGSRGFSRSGYDSGKEAGAGFRVGSKKIGASNLLTG